MGTPQRGILVSKTVGKPQQSNVQKFLTIRDNVRVRCKISEKENGEDDTQIQSNTYPRKIRSSLLETGK